MFKGTYFSWPLKWSIFAAMNVPTQQDVDTGNALPLMEALPCGRDTTGSAAYFIRIGGCDVGCHCVCKSWDAERHPATPIADCF